VSKVQRLLFNETTEALANAAWRMGMSRLALLRPARDAVEPSLHTVAGDSSGRNSVVSDSGSELALVTCIPGDRAIPAFLDNAPRVVADVPISTHFTLSAWVFAGRAPGHEQEALSKLRATDLAAVDVGAGSTAQA